MGAPLSPSRAPTFIAPHDGARSIGMTFERTFHVTAPPDEIWSLLKDAPRLASHIPGLRLTQTADERTHTAVFTTQLGSQRTSFELQVSVESLDDATRTAIFKIHGGDSMGHGADATVTSAVAQGAGGSDVSVHADVEFTGMPTTTGFGFADDAAGNTANEFAANLERAFRR